MMKKVKKAVCWMMLLVFIFSMIGCKKEEITQESALESVETFTQTQNTLDDETNESIISETHEIKESMDSTAKELSSSVVPDKQPAKDKVESRPQPVIKETLGESESNMQITESEPVESQPIETQHTHVWQEIVEIIHHEAVTDYVWVEESPAWDEDVFSSQVVCGCGSIFESVLGWEQHSIDGCIYGYSVQQIKTGSIHHEAQGHNESIIVADAYDETVITGYHCACGAVQ